MLDSGSCCNVLSERAWRSIPDIDRPPLKPTSISLHGASGASLVIKGEVDVILVVEGETYSTSMVVSELAADAGVLGVPFLTEFGGHLDLGGGS